MTHEDYVDQVRQEIAETAAAMLSGVLSFIEGSRRMQRLRFEAELDDDPDVIPFVAIDSETDALPMGDVRKLWAPDALAKLQPKIEKAEKWAREIGLLHCQALIDRFRTTTQDRVNP